MFRIRKFSFCLILFLCLFDFYIFSQNNDSNKLLSDGIEFFRNGLYKQAIINFRDILINPELYSYHADAYFWISKSYMVLGRLNEAEKNLEYYLMNFPAHNGYSEAMYQKGRLLFMQNEFENAIQVLTNFIDKYPNSIFLSNAYYWIGESLYLLGRLDDALKVYKNIVQNYPDSFKFEAAKYRMSIIEFKKRENELLKLLKWSHTEALKSLDEYQKKERTYEQAIVAYQKKIALQSTSANTTPSAVTEKDAEIDSLKKENSDLKKTNQYLESKVASMTTTSVIPDSTTKTSGGTDKNELQLKERLLDVKAEALALKERLLKLLEESLGGK